MQQISSTPAATERNGGSHESQDESGEKEKTPHQQYDLCISIWQ